MDIFILLTIVFGFSGTLIGVLLAVLRDKSTMIKFMEANARTAETALKPEEIGVADWLDRQRLRRLAREGELAKTPDGRYYAPCKDRKDG
jgi:hypothetical protein